MSGSDASVGWWRESLTRRGQDAARWEEDPFARPVLDEVDDVAAICVLSRFEVRSFVESLVALLGTFSDDERRRWYRAFTRVVYLAGDPRKITRRFAPDVVDASGTIAWFRPRPRVGNDPLSRLLALFVGRAPAASFVPNALTIGSAQDGSRLEVRLDVDGMSVSECMIHLAHCVAEPWASECWDGASGIRVLSTTSHDDAIATSAYVRPSVDPTGRRNVVGTSHVLGGHR